MSKMPKEFLEIAYSNNVEAWVMMRDLYAEAGDFEQAATCQSMVDHHSKIFEEFLLSEATLDVDSIFNQRIH